MSEIVEIKVSPDTINDEAIIRAKLKRHRKSSAKMGEFVLRRKSLDSRQRNIFYLMRFEVYDQGEIPVNHHKTVYQNVENKPSVIIIGAGPAGYFAALKLIERGIKPIVLDRGKDVRARRRDLRAIQQDGQVNEHSNYCFGEGGAGTYSDGKLYTRSQKRGNIIGILNTLHDHGAPDDILFDAHPHIGSNKLPKIVSNIRETILKHGGEVHFEHFVTDLIINNDKIEGCETADGQRFYSKAVILATGHSARDIFELLHKKGIKLEAKDFALGVRIEHPQSLVDAIQYRQNPRHPELPAASYRLTTQVNNKGVFSFCMCPGGLIVPAATHPGELVVNGMSLSRRDSPYSNSGFVTAVDKEDFKDFEELGIFAGLEYQKHFEQIMWQHGDGSQKAPAQLVQDFLKGRLSENLLDTSYIPGIYSARMDQLLPAPIVERLRAGLRAFGKRHPSYIGPKAQIIGIESRTSSPIRIPRNKDGQHVEIEGLYPCGEGAGYAGGILSACMDGEKIANKIEI